MLFRVGDLLCCCCVVVPVLWSLNSLRKKVDLTPPESEAELNVEQKSITKLKLFQRYYLLVVAYVYLRVIITYMLNMYVDYKNEWTIDFVDELLSLGFYIFICYLFRPEADNPFFEEDDDNYIAPVLTPSNSNETGMLEPSLALDTDNNVKTQNSAVLTGDDEIDMDDIMEVIKIRCDIDADDITVGWQSYEDGLRIIIYVKDEETAKNIASSLEAIVQGEGCDYGVLCEMKYIGIVAPEKTLSGAHQVCHSIQLLVILFMVQFFI